MKKLSKLEVVAQTVEYYKTHKRSLNSQANPEDPSNEPLCLYNGPGGCHCAFALWVTEDTRHLLKEGLPACQNLKRKIGIKLKPEVEHLCNDFYFWTTLQNMHDSDELWEQNNQGGVWLNCEGKKYLINWTELWES